MRTASAVVALLLSLSACYTLPEPQLQPDNPRPLHAQFIPRLGSGSSMMFSVSRPAYVAVFEIHPGAGTSLVYPTIGRGAMDGRVFAGTTSLLTARAWNQDQYHFAGAASAMGPRFYFLIASERPLDLARFGPMGMRLRREIGTAAFASLNAYHTMESLARAALPNLEDEASWTTDLYVDWPEVLYNTPGGRSNLVVVRCNGYVMRVPFEWVSAVNGYLCAAPSTSIDNQPRPEGETPADSTQVTEPERRKPLPPEQSGDTRPWMTPDDRLNRRIQERITASAQLEEALEERIARGGGAGWRVEQPHMGGRRLTPAGDDRERVRPTSGGSSTSSAGEAAERPRPEPRVEPRSAPRVEPRVEPRSEPPSAPAPAPAPSPAPAPDPGSSRPGCNPCGLS